MKTNIDTKSKEPSILTNFLDFFKNKDRSNQVWCGHGQTNPVNSLTTAAVDDEARLAELKNSRPGNGV